MCGFCWAKKLFSDVDVLPLKKRFYVSSVSLSVARRMFAQPRRILIQTNGGWVHGDWRLRSGGRSSPQVAVLGTAVGLEDGVVDVRAATRTASGKCPRLQAARVCKHRGERLKVKSCPLPPIRFGLDPSVSRHSGGLRFRTGGTL